MVTIKNDVSERSKPVPSYLPPFTLTPRQLTRVTAILEGRRVIGSMREIQEVRNAIESAASACATSRHSGKTT